MALHVEVLLGPERASRGDVSDAHALVREPEERGHLAAVVPDALALRVDLDRPVPVRHGERGLGLEEGVLDELRPERLGHHVGRTGEGGVDVAALHARDREYVAALVQLGRTVGQRRERVRHRLEHLVLDLDERRRRAGRMARLGGDGCDHVADVRGDLALGHELPPVALDRALHAIAGHVGGRDDGHDARRRERLRDVDSEDPRPRVVREPEGAVEHAGRSHVADEDVVPEGELGAAVAGRARPDPAAAVGLRKRLAAARARPRARSRRSP